MKLRYHMPRKLLARLGIVKSFQTRLISFLAKLVFTIDFRSPDPAVIGAMDTELRSGAGKIAQTLGLDISYEQAGALDPVEFDSACVNSKLARRRLGLVIHTWILCLEPDMMLFDEQDSSNRNGNVPLR